MITGIVDLSRLVEILSGPELYLFFYLFNALFIMVGVIFAKINIKTQNLFRLLFEDRKT